MEQPLFAIIGLLLLLMLLGSPVIFAIGFAGLAYFFVKPGMMPLLHIYAHKFFTGMDVFIWLSIPLFIIAGEIMSSIGMTERLVTLSRLLVGRLRGGLAYVNVVGSMLFSGVSGSALADISALGPIEIKMMEKDGYPKDFSAALTVSSAIQGPIIPPSIPLIMFAALTNVSIAALFLAGAIPGLMLGLGQMLVIFYLARRRGFKANPIAGLTLALALHIIYNAFFAIFMPLIILGGILSGVFTATEAAAIAVFYALLVGVLAYRNLSFKALWAILDRSIRTSASVYLIVGFASVISWILANERLPFQLRELVVSYDLQPWVLLLVLNIFFLINGLWIGDSVQLLLFAPLFTPILASMGVDPVHFGVVMVLNVMIGLMTPPYGLALYLGSSISGVSLAKIVTAALPFLASNLIVLGLVTYVPALSLTLPRLFGFN
ncbi:TRAP transporter large permease [uncultured Cohaesibacter sp.]|uniref:TRAP transporter large permease n=1 Tax=uncultured Cohaesibacter sp. TaxID=1002546 RepID=UPI0029C9AFF0|nr:TRAP transporter large permease [uncultured Cohaesibacter sp.]